MKGKTVTSLHNHLTDQSQCRRILRKTIPSLEAKEEKEKKRNNNNQNPPKLDPPTPFGRKSCEAQRRRRRRCMRSMRRRCRRNIRRRRRRRRRSNNQIPPKLGPPTPFGRKSCEAQRHEFSQRHNREAAEFYIKECRFKDIDLYIDLDIDLDIVFGA